MISHNRQGQSIVELIISISIFVVIASSAMIIILGSFSSSRLAEEETQAHLLALEGIEAVRSIRDVNWTNLANGDYGVASASGTWIFSGTFDVHGKYTRKINVSSVNRLNGNIVTSGGTLDPDSKKVQSRITWNFSPARANTITLTSYFTNWQEGKVKGPRTPESSALTVDTSLVSLTNPFRTLRGITLGSSGTPFQITIDRMQVSWTGNQANNLTRISINGSTVWNGSALSGTNIDINNTQIASESNNIPLELAFNKNMRGSVFTIIFRMTDVSAKTVSGITPP